MPPADHDALDAAVFHDLVHLLRMTDVTVADDRHRDAFGNLTDGIPICITGIPLHFGATVDGECLDADVFQLMCQLRSDNAFGVPTESNLRGDGCVWQTIHHCGCQLHESVGCFEQGGSRHLTGHFLGWTSEVEVDEIGMGMIDDSLSCLRHRPGVVTKDLYTHRTLLFAEVDGFPHHSCPRLTESLMTNSVTSTSAPSSLHNCRYTMSVNPAMGAR